MKKRTKGILIGGALLAAAAIATVGVGSDGFTNSNIKTWFGKSKNAVMQTVDMPAEYSAMALQSVNENDIDYTFVHDSDETSTTFAVTKAKAPEIAMGSTPHATADMGKSDTRLCISVKCDRDSLNYTTGVINVEARNYAGPGEYGSWTFNVTAQKQTFYIEENELKQVFATSNRSSVGFYATISNVTGYSNSDEAGYIVYDLSNNTYDFNYSGSTVTIPLNPNMVKSKLYFVLVSANERTGLDSRMYLSDTSLNRGTAISLVDNSFVIDLSKVSFWDNVTSAVDKPSICVGLSSNLYDGYFGQNWTYSYFKITRLATPTNLTYNAGTLTWNAVSGASRYGVFWTDKEGIEQHVVVTQPTYTFDLNELGDGDYTVRVRALGNIGGSIADSEVGTMRLTAYNASNTVTQLVALTFSVNGDSIMKLVPYGKNVANYCYEVKVPNKEFIGWYYDSGFSRKVEPTDVLSGDTTIYARLSDKKVVERAPTWWDKYKWYVIGGIIGLAALGIVAGVVVKTRKTK